MSVKPMVKEYKANLRMTVTDFGPDCKLLVNEDCLIPLEDHIIDGVCSPIDVGVRFQSDCESRRTDMAIQVLRFWKGEDRLIYTRRAHIAEGDNELRVSYMGVTPVHRAPSVVGRLFNSASGSN